MLLENSATDWVKFEWSFLQLAVPFQPQSSLGSSNEQFEPLSRSFGQQ